MKRKKKAAPLEHAPRQFTKTKYFYALMAAVVVFVVIFTVLAASAAPQQHTLTEGSVATETITAPRDVVDTVTTEKLRQEARDGVQPIYVEDEAVTEEVNTDIETFFANVLNVYNLGQQYKATILEQTPDTVDWVGELTQSNFAAMQKVFDPMEASDEEIMAIVSSSPAVINRIKNETLSRVKEDLDNGIKPEFLETQQEKIKQDIKTTLYDVSQDLLAFTNRCVDDDVQANMKENVELTEKERSEKAAAIEDRVYKAGQNIVVQGELVTAAQIAMLDSLGMLQANDVVVLLYVGVGLLAAVLIAAFCAYIILYQPQLLQDRRMINLLGILVLLTFLLGAVFAKTNSNSMPQGFYAIMPIAFFSMLMTILFTPSLALFGNMVLSVLIAVMVNTDGLFTSDMVYALLIYLVGGSVGVFFLKGSGRRSRIVVAGLVVGIANVLMSAGLGLMASTDHINTLSRCGWGFVSGLLSAVICIGTLPLWEAIFNVVTPSKLLELAAPDQPLFKKLMLEAPGTYHHSIFMANLAEGAAEAIGADPALARVGAYYHDIGKTKRPYFFTENQMGENPHDKLSPEASAKMIAMHPRDGLQMAQKYKLPKQVQDIIVQHHGTTVILYFYHKAVSQRGEENVDINAFRYPGPRPRSKEAAIIMLADTAEAAVRSLATNDAAIIRKKVEQLIKQRMDDGQLKESPLTFKDITTITETFVKIFTGMMHGRIEYPDMDITAKEQGDAGDTKPAGGSAV